MGGLTWAERLKGRAQVDQDWAEAEAWYLDTSHEDLKRLIAKVNAGNHNARAAVRSLSEVEALCVLMAWSLVVSEVALRVEEADSD